MSQGAKNTKFLIVAIVLLLVGLLVAGIFLFKTNSELNDIEELNEITKQQMEDEYESISMQYEGYKFSIKNDSLLDQLNNEQAKVQRLLEELKTVKASNTAEIKRLNGELTSLRAILKSYVAQIDSLNRANAKLTQEKAEITEKYHETSRTLNAVSQEKQNLSEKVTLASKLDAVAINVQATNSKGKVQKKIKKIERLAVSFVLSKNITAQPGERTIYVRIMKPDDDVLVKSRSNTFAYENRDINYSMKRIVEYQGEEMPVTLYWDVEEFLQAGTYRVDIFADGNRIGSKSFSLED